MAPYRLAKQLAKAGLMLSALTVSGSLMAAPPELSVEGSTITANGEAASLSGMSLFWSNTGWGGEKYYTAESVGGVKTFFEGNLVRAAMGVEESGGYLSDLEGPACIRGGRRRHCQRHVCDYRLALPLRP